MKPPGTCNFDRVQGLGDDKKSRWGDGNWLVGSDSVAIYR